VFWGIAAVTAPIESSAVSRGRREGRGSAVRRGGPGLAAWLGAYNGLFVPGASLALPLVGRLNGKVAAYRAQGREWRSGLDAALSRRPDVAAGDALWVHAASAGELLQARALLRELRRAAPAAPLVLTYTSPSAGPFLERFQGADLVLPLPPDTRSNVGFLLNAVRPAALALVDAEIWPNLVSESARRGIPVALVSARLAPGAGRLRVLARPFYRALYPLLDVVACVDGPSAERFDAAGARVASLHVTGDLRVDETLRRSAGVPAATSLPLPWILPVLAAGSTLPDDEAVLLPALERLRDRGVFFSLVIAPHEVTERRLAALESALEASGWTPGRLSALTTASDLGDAETGKLGALGSGTPIGTAEQGQPSSLPALDPASQIARLGPVQLEIRDPVAEAQPVDAIVVDRVGLLYRLYAGTAAAYVGGAFRGAPHNVMEPAAFGVPVVTGPRVRKSWMAGEMLRAGGLFPVADVEAACAVLEHLLGARSPGPAGGRARDVLLAHAGAAERTLRALVERGWLRRDGPDGERQSEAGASTSPRN
jgi:3-deoxy-D-manno-octulosonic-acid transferase